MLDSILDDTQPPTPNTGINTMTLNEPTTTRQPNIPCPVATMDLIRELFNQSDGTSMEEEAMSEAA